MARLVWDNIGERTWEAGVERGVHYTPTAHGVYGGGVAWNGLISVTEKPTGAEANDQYADNIKYLTMYSAENFEGTIEAFTYPDEFGECDGSVELTAGVHIGQQPRKAFGMCYRTILGNDVDGQDYGYKLHMIYGAMVSPSERNYETLNDSPEAQTLSWDLTTIPVPVKDHKPTAYMTVNSTKVDPAKLAQLEDILYGSDSEQARLPSPDEIVGIIGGDSTTFVSARDRARAMAESLPQAQVQEQILSTARTTSTSSRIKTR